MSDEMPEGWSATDIGSLFAVNTPGHWGEDGGDGSNVFVLRSANFLKSGGLKYETAAPRKFDQKKLGQKRLAAGDILLERSGGSPAQPVGRVNRFEADGVFSASNFLQILRVRQEVDGWFAYYLLDGFYAAGGTENLQKATTGIRNLDFAAYLATSVLLPPLDEQRRIAKVLRSVDEAIAREIDVNEAAEATLDHALAATIPSPEKIGGHWTTTTIGEFATVITGKTPSTKDAGLWGGEIPFVTPTDMDGSVRSVRAARSITQAAIKQTKIAPANSVLFTCIASIGKLCLNQEPVAFNQQINACACRDATDAAFLYWTLRRLTPQIRAMSGTTAVPIVNKTAFSRVSFALPPPASRHEIVEVLSSISEVIESALRTISSLTELKRRISSDLLSGRVRVPA